jgi:hypothetical protein
MGFKDRTKLLLDFKVEADLLHGAREGEGLLVAVTSPVGSGSEVSWR